MANEDDKQMKKSTDKKADNKEVKKVKYAESLQGDVKKRYAEKLKIIDNIDPYEVHRSDWDTDVTRGKMDTSLFPGITYPDIVIYLSNTPSPYSLEDFKAYKSLESFNYCNNGWVKAVKVKAVKEDIRLVSARVSKFLFTLPLNS